MKKPFLVLPFFMMTLLVVSCGNEKSSSSASSLSGAHTVTSAAMVDGQKFQEDYYTDFLGNNNKSSFSPKVLFDGIMSLTDGVDAETSSIFFNHGDAIGLLPRGVKPLKEDSSYTLMSESRNKGIVEFNSRAFPNGIRSVMVSGLDLVLDENHRLFKTYNNQADVEEITIVADTVKIAADFKFPATNVTIKAREITFTDKGVINLTPLSLLENPNQFENGKAGNKSGDLNLFSETLNILGNLENRIILNGGKGQNAGIGRTGNPGSSMPAPISFRRIKEGAPTLGTRFPNLVFAAHVLNERAGTQAWPGDGTDGVPGGLPGVGGNAGKLTHAYADQDLLNKITSLKGGLPGDHAPEALGGQPGQPVVALWMIHSMKNNRVIENFTSHTAVAGKNAVRTDVIAKGSDGSIVFDQNKIFELNKNENFEIASSDQSSLKLKYARALYMNFFIDEAFDSFSELLNSSKDLTSIQNLEVTNSSLMEINKIRSHLDYFGNEATWFPELSFEISKAFNEKEIESSFSNLYYVYSLRNAQSTIESKMKSIESLEKNIRQDIEGQQVTINDSMDKIPDLQNQVELISAKERMIQAELDMIEKEINRSAIANLTPKKHNNTLKIIAAICTVFPAGQPALAVVGNALPKIIDLADSDRDWKEIIKEGVGIYNEIKKIDWEASRNNWDENYGKLIGESWKGLTRQQIQDRLKEIYKAGKPIIDVIIAQKKAINQNEAPRSAIEQEIVRIKNVHPRYSKVVQLLAELTEQKQMFVRSLNDITKRISLSREMIVGNFIQMSAMSSDYLNISGNYNPDFSRSLAELEERAKSNLLKYRYYFLKSYGYRFLKSPRVNYNPVAVFDKLVAMIDYNKGGDLDKEQYTLLKQVFVQDLQPLMSDVLTDIQMGSKVYSASTTLYFTKEEVAKLTNGESILVNLKTRDIYSESEEDIRIAKMSISKFVMTEPESISNPNLDLEIAHTGRFDLTKAGKSYAFEMGSMSRWTYRYNMVEKTGEMNEISKSFKALISSLLATLGQPPMENSSLEFFSLVGGNGELKIKFKDDSVRRLKGASLTNLAVKIDYLYSNAE